MKKPIPLLAAFPAPSYPLLKKWRPRGKLTLVDWLKCVEGLIQIYSTPPRTRGRYKGHGDTNIMWTAALALIIDRYIKSQHRDKAYDGNMAVAAFTGYVLSQWYLHVQRAKAYDANRPLKLRRIALKRRKQWLGRFVETAGDDAVIGKVWAHQQLSPPYGKKAKGGKFV